MPDSYLGLEQTVAYSDEEDDVDIITTARNINAGDYFTIGFCLKHN